MASAAGATQEDGAQGGDRNQPEEYGQDLWECADVLEVGQLDRGIGRLYVGDEWPERRLQMLEAFLGRDARFEPHRHHASVAD